MLRNKEVRIEEQNNKLNTDLTTPKYEYMGEKKIKIEGKDDIKKRIGRSPDYGDAFCYALFVDKFKQTKTARVELF